MKSQTVFVLLTSVVLSVIPATARSNTDGMLSWNGGFGIRIGWHGGGTADVDGHLYDLQRGLSAGVLFDIPIVAGFGLEPTIDVHVIDAESWDGRLSPALSCGIRYSVTVAEGVLELRPGASIGLALLQQAGPVDDTALRVIHLRMELLFLASRGSGLLLEIGRFGADGLGSTHVELEDATFIRGGFVF